MDTKVKRVIVTGATGALGVALVKEWIRRGTEVLVFCREHSQRNAQIPDDPLVTRRFCSLQELALVQNDTGKHYDVFYHLAWDGTTGEARNDLHRQSRNIKYALQAVDAAERFGCKAFVGVGSQAEYGRVEGVLKPETPTFPETGYGIAKLGAGLMTREYAGQKRMRHIWVRVLSAYGPCDGEQSMVMSTIRKLQAGQTPAFTKAEQLWDYLYSEDAARAFCDLGEHGKDGKVYVLGSGIARPLSDYIRAIRDCVDPSADLDFGAIPYAEKQVMHLQADIGEITRDTGWRPQVRFEDGIRTIMENPAI